MTRIAIIGYGAMGQELERLAPHHDCLVAAVYEVDKPVTANDAADWDVAIDFSDASAVVGNCAAVCQAGKGLVIGVTGWSEHLDTIRSLVQKANIGCVYGSNFSVGVQMFFRLARAAGMLVHQQPEYDVMIHEWHHKRKKDSPSGTALTLGSILLDEVRRKTHITTETQHGPIHPAALHVSSTRGGEIAGRHVITLDGPHDRIDLIHDARSRVGFASGALRAATWIRNRKGLHDFTDIFTLL